MHEMSIALNIIKIAEEELERANGKGIDNIRISVGKLSGVVVESLKFALDAAGNDGPLANSKIIIEEVPAKMQCLSCDHEFEAEDYYITCPNCNAYKLKALSGKELLVKSLTIY
jgi:hydrogenase nickel incorporation protein HypA/HybF